MAKTTDSNCRATDQNFGNRKEIATSLEPNGYRLKIVTGIVSDMRKSLAILLVITCGYFSIIAFGQSAKSQAQTQVNLSDLLELFTPISIADENFIANANQNALVRLSFRCDVGFIDDGTNYWALKTAGASEALINEIVRCTQPSTIEKVRAERKNLTEQQMCRSQKAVAGDLVRLLYRGKDVAGRKRVLNAMNEFIKRYDQDDRCEDPDTNELLKWLKVQIPRIQVIIKNLEEVN
jgi:hypothetical protein